jgi:hypothetical protein
VKKYVQTKEAAGKHKANDRVFAPAVMYAGLHTHTSIAHIKYLFEQNCPSIIQSTAQSNAYSLSLKVHKHEIILNFF